MVQLIDKDIAWLEMFRMEKMAVRRVGRHSTEVAFTLHARAARVRFLALEIFSRYKI